MTRLGDDEAAAIRVTDMDDVLVAKIASGRHTWSSSRTSPAFVQNLENGLHNQVAVGEVFQFGRSVDASKGLLSMLRRELLAGH